MKKHFLLMSCAIGALALSSGAMAETAAATTTTASNSSGTTIGELVVTAERKQENLQSTPIAVSAFSAASLQNKKLDGGQNLVLQIPNSNYTRSNFGGFNFKIRGIGTDVITFGGTTGVSINENELPVSDNNFANTDFYDVERVEVLRGPQGTLYGRNATGGAVDIITNKPSDQFSGYATAGYGNYNGVKLSGAVNIPIGDTISLRVAGFRYTQDGFGENSYLNKSVDGRDLGSLRATLRFHPNDKFDAYLMYEHYGEDDDRNRIGKQLCITDPGPSSVGGVPIAPAGGPIGTNYAAFLNQGCIPGSLYQRSAYGALNSNSTLGGVLANLAGLNNGTNLFANNPLQNSNLHDIQSTIQPLFTSQQDLFDFHVDYHLTDNLTLTSITGFNHSQGTSAEDYNRIVPSSPYTPVGFVANLLFPNGVVHDPQTGTSNLVTSYDYGTAEAKEYTQEVRLTSSFSGKLNFAAGGFYSERTTEPNSGNYYVESNGLTAFSLVNNFAYDATYWGYIGAGAPASVATAAAAAAAPLGGLINIGNGYPPNGSGHNYYDARNGGSWLKSYAGFGEVYYNITPDLKLTLGGRYSIDQLYNVQYPISLFSTTPNNGPAYTDPGFPQFGIPGTPNAAIGGFPSSICTTSTTACLIPQQVTYREFTGRANLDWTPTVSFTDKTLVYLTYARGYKGGGFNTPCQASLGGSGGSTAACGYPLSFAPEFIDDYEIGTKNSLLGGSLILNADAFYYNYEGYQVSRIVSESSVNENVNAKIYGVEFESQYSPIHNLVFNANIGFLHSAIDNGQYSIDSLNLTQGDPNYTVVKTTGGQNCLAPTGAAATWIAGSLPAAGLGGLCNPVTLLGTPGAPTSPTQAYLQSVFGKFYPVVNGQYTNANQFGEAVNLSGKRLPNTPPWTVSIGAQYTVELPSNWSATLRGDFYWQDQSYARIYNAVNDLLQAYHNVNATLNFHNGELGLDVQFWVKNLFNAQPITGVYLTDPTSGLFQNVFTLDPRTYGVQLTKRW